MESISVLLSRLTDSLYRRQGSSSSIVKKDKKQGEINKIASLFKILLNIDRNKDENAMNNSEFVHLLATVLFTLRSFQNFDAANAFEGLLDRLRNIIGTSDKEKDKYGNVVHVLLLLSNNLSKSNLGPISFDIIKRISNKIGKGVSCII